MSACNKIGRAYAAGFILKKMVRSRGLEPRTQ